MLGHAEDLGGLPNMDEVLGTAMTKALAKGVKPTVQSLPTASRRRNQPRSMDRIAEYDGAYRSRKRHPGLG